MINSAMKAERSSGSHPRENLNRRAAGKRRHGGLGKGYAAGCPEAGRTKFAGAADGDTGSDEARSPG